MLAETEPAVAPVPEDKNDPKGDAGNPALSVAMLSSPPAASIVPPSMKLQTGAEISPMDPWSQKQRPPTVALLMGHFSPVISNPSAVRCATVSLAAKSAPCCLSE
jgi:hypothetical protein